MSNLCKCRDSKSSDSTVNWLASDPYQVDNSSKAIPQQTENTIALNLKSKLARLWQGISAAVNNFLSDEPRIWQRRDLTGCVWWNVYDPSTNRYTCLSSEAEVLQWLEERFYY